MTIQKQKEDLTKAIQGIVRARLQSEYPTVFSMTSSRTIWKNFRTKELSEKARILLALNGFERVPLPKPMDMLMLAEGVVAFPNIYSRLSRSPEQVKFVLFSQPIIEPTTTTDSKSSKQYPEIIQEDIQLYRVLENQAERIINALYNTLQSGTRRFIQKPIELVAQRIETVLELLRQQLSMVHLPTESESAPHPNIRLPSMVESSTFETKENLLVLGEGRTEMTLYAHMSPSVRLLALPYVLGHKSASTLVSVSLVIFGAIPLAYRSLNYAFLYPGLSEALAASVIGTITYGIWSQRYNARISQTRVVTNGLLHRIQARDDAVIFLLQEGAVRQVSQAILAEYLERYDKSLIPARHRRFGNEILAQLGTRNKIKMTTSTTASKKPFVSKELINPLELAAELGLLEQVGKKTLVLQGQDNNAIKYTAVGLEDALFRVQEHSRLLGE